MYDLASLNAARGSRRRHRRHRRGHHNRAGGGFLGTKTEALTRFGAQKLAEGFVGVALGEMEGNGGEPVFFQSKDSGGKVDPTSGIGLKAGLAFVANAGQLAQILLDHSFGRKMGMLGDALDGAVAGTASASWVSYAYMQGNLWGVAKRKAAGAAGTRGALDYSKQSRGEIPQRTSVPADARPAAGSAAFAPVSKSAFYYR